ncbi:helix-turn-helix domain-containing protein [Eleftheria terrae]|uniref:helix-turn-helix domain-containing protein n=1 Tax=Eleftheria terrae TaxID=1597781 RepID=UPI00263B4A0C|nr:helix-turn-helix domain-containing protein [Eleftheria terrae]WKB53343.1 helix-turn-helix domain-containing protein [Eleftheria terrae]
MSIESQTRKLNRLRLAALHMEAHLSQPLRLDELADAAALSRYHFERSFAAYAGETPLARVRRLRLHRAREQLACGAAASILQLALDSGYASPEAFARAYRSAFGHPPSAEPAVRVAAPPAGLHGSLCRLPALGIQYISYQGHLDNALWPFDELRARALSREVPRPRRHGWAVHLEGGQAAWAGSSQLQAALLSAPLREYLPGLDRGWLPAGLYAVFRLDGSYDAPPAQALADWLDRHGGWRIIDGAPWLRRFGNPATYLPALHERRCWLWVPVQRRSPARAGRPT